MLDMEIEHQSAAFEWSRRVYQWNSLRRVAEQPAKDHLKAENDRKIGVLSHVQHHINAHRRHINNIQKSVLEVELEKATEQVGGSNGQVPEITDAMNDEAREKVANLKERIAKALELVGVSSDVKLDLGTTEAAIKKALKPLKAHVPPKKGKYVKTGEFTKEKRAEKVTTARPYNKTGKHINDFQKPRFPSVRDQQIVERAKLLGVSEDEFRRSVMGRGSAPSNPPAE
jgi:hypothetical protein